MSFSRNLVSPVPTLWVSATDNILSLQFNGQIVGYVYSSKFLHNNEYRSSKANCFYHGFLKLIADAFNRIELVRNTQTLLGHKLYNPQSKLELQFVNSSLHQLPVSSLSHVIYVRSMPQIGTYTFCLVLGTREEKSASEGEDWYKPIANLLKKISRCCQGNQAQEDSGQWRHAANQDKHGSIVQSRTSIKTELTNTSSKVSFS